MRGLPPKSEGKINFNSKGKFKGAGETPALRKAKAKGKLKNAGETPALRKAKATSKSPGLRKALRECGAVEGGEGVVEQVVGGALPIARAERFARGKRVAIRAVRLAARPFDRADDPVARGRREW